MDIDSSTVAAARRNLVLISIVFILYTLGDATLSVSDGADKTRMRLFASSITIKIDTVIIFAWVMFGWFLLRFWQFSNHKNDWLTFTKEMYDSKLMLRLYKTHNLKRMPSYEGHAYQPVWGDWVWSSFQGTGFRIYKYQILTKLKFFIYISIKTPYFGQFYFPYCLAAFALAITLL